MRVTGQYVPVAFSAAPVGIKIEQSPLAADDACGFWTAPFARRRAPQWGVSPVAVFVTAVARAHAARPGTASTYSGNLREGLHQTSDVKLDLAWMTSHVFRKTVATRLDEAGLSGRQIADVLGHEGPSTTQDHFMDRKVVNAAMAARILAQRKSGVCRESVA